MTLFVIVCQYSIEKTLIFFPLHLSRVDRSVLPCVGRTVLVPTVYPRINQRCVSVISFRRVFVALVKLNRKTDAERRLK